MAAELAPNQKGNFQRQIENLKAVVGELLETVSTQQATIEELTDRVEVLETP